MLARQSWLSAAIFFCLLSTIISLLPAQYQPGTARGPSSGAFAPGICTQPSPPIQPSFTPRGSAANLFTGAVGGTQLVSELPRPDTSRPAPNDATRPYNQYNPPGDWKTHEDYNLPQDQWSRAYREGLRDGYDYYRNEDDINNRTQKLLRTRDEALHAGVQAFQEGQYDQAIPLLRRAFELQPNLLYLRFDLRKDYGQPDDFASQLRDLQAFLSANPDFPDGYLLLGYELLHSGQRNQAFQHAAQLDPVDTLSRKFLKISFPRPAQPPAPQAKRPTIPIHPASRT